MHLALNIKLSFLLFTRLDSSGRCGIISLTWASLQGWAGLRELWGPAKWRAGLTRESNTRTEWSGNGNEYRATHCPFILA